MKILIVCGGRNYARYGLVYGAMESERGNIRYVFQGGQRGADTHAKNSAVLLHIPYYQIDAKWTVYWRDAGPIRNEEMLERALEIPGTRKHRDDTVELWAFRDDLYAGDDRTGANGTLDMVARALKRGVPCRWYSKSLRWRPLRWDAKEMCVRVGDPELPIG